ncbi:armadillo-type protein [Rhypophila decipiens]|uniref:Armadillo-type protein n=1 Tax=Rhypophila decipiens TaxID=261697 RepID=A0AAN7BDS6_9PEZI|nr:armadillo-type protein [Rhypophila decipiens]
MEQIPLPSSLEEVQNLIRALYQPNHPDTISQIQDVLQRLQRSDEGWRLAQDLFQNREDNIRFFAVLTIIVKLNRDSAALTDDLAKELLSTLINWVFQSLAEGSASFVVKKLCSALITFFLHFPALWEQSIRHFVYCLDVGSAVPVEGVDEKLPTTVLVEGLEPQRLKVAIWFATALVDEVGKTDMNSAKFMPVHEKTVKNGPDVGCLLARGFAAQEIQSDTLSCFQSWILYAQRVPLSTSGVLLDPLRQLVALALPCFASPHLFNTAAELFSDVLSNYSNFFTPEHYQALFELLNSPWAEQQYSQLIHGKNHEEDGIAFGVLLLAYGEAKVDELMKSTSQSAQNFLSKLAGLLAADGFMVGQDHIFVPALEFWSTFAETMIDAVYADDDDSLVVGWKSYAEEHIKMVVSNCWRKIQWPPLDLYSEWDSTERTGFSDARKDVADLLQSVHTIIGKTLVSHLVSAYQAGVNGQNWIEIEASIYCLAALSDCIAEDEGIDGFFNQVFNAGFFKLMAKTNTGADGDLAPYRLKQTGLQFIERYKEYFVRNPHHLFEALSLLFQSVNDPVLGSHSARAFSSLCQSNGPKVAGQVDTLVEEYRLLRENRQLPLDPLAEERVILGITCIIQACPKGEDRRLEVFWRLYSLLDEDFVRAIKLKEDPALLDLDDANYQRGVVVEGIPGPHSNWMVRFNHQLQQYKQTAAAQGVGIPSGEIALQIATRSLRCLSNMARGMQDSAEVNLEAEGGRDRLPEDRLKLLQTTIISRMAQLRRTFPRSSEIADCVYNVYRAGFIESEPGPFVFPPESVVDFFVVQRAENSNRAGDPNIMTTPKLGTLLSTACTFVGSLHGTPDSVVRPQLARLLPWVISLLQEMGEPESDTEVAQNGICFVQRVMTKYPDLPFMAKPEGILEFFLGFAIKVLGGKEPLPKGAAADFWSAFMSLKPSYSSTSPLSAPEIQSLVASVMQDVGPLVAQTLMDNIGGNAARSELDKLSDPLKKLIVNHVHAQQWLQAALFRDDFPGNKTKTLGPEDKMLFLKKVVGLRGARQTNTVVREFWMACRGANYAYAS